MESARSSSKSWNWRGGSSGKYRRNVSAQVASSRGRHRSASVIADRTPSSTLLPDFHERSSSGNLILGSTKTPIRWRSGSAGNRCAARAASVARPSIIQASPSACSASSSIPLRSPASASRAATSFVVLSTVDLGLHPFRNRAASAGPRNLSTPIASSATSASSILSSLRRLGGSLLQAINDSHAMRNLLLASGMRSSFPASSTASYA
ncbi:hypothetical protein D9M68_586560 [compost metagenome]